MHLIVPFHEVSHSSQLTLFKRIQPCHIHSCDQQMNIMCAFISDHTFQVHHVAHDGVFAGDAHAAQHLPCIPGRYW